MRSILRDAVLAARLGPGRGSRSLELVWAALTPFERAQFEREAGRLAERGVRAELADGGAPLFHVGPYESIGPRVLGVCGPRAARGAALALAEQAARWAASTGVTVVAGDADGVERAAVRATLDAGGLAVSVLAEGLRHGEPSRSRAAGPAGTVGQARPAGPCVDRGVPTSRRGSGRHVVVSPCAPGQPWSVDAAMACNATIAELCTALVAFDAAGTGATLDTGMQALASGRPVLAVGATAGSRLLVDYGATAAVDEIELMWWLAARLPAADGHRVAGAARAARAPGPALRERTCRAGVAGPVAASGSAGRAVWRHAGVPLAARG